MKNIAALTWREINAYFFSPLAYIVLTVFLAMSGFVFYMNLALDQTADMRGWMAWMIFVMMFIAPFITMRLMAEEARSGSLEMLMTSPVTDAEVVMSKYFGAMLFYMFMLAPSVIYVAILFRLGSPDPGPILTGYLGLILAGSSLMAIGLFCSTLARSQIVAAILGLALIFFLWLIDLPAPFVGGGLSRLLEYLALPAHMHGFVKGVIDLRDVVYFLSVAALFLFMSVKVVESRKWR